MTWRTIDSAPRDGTRILVWTKYRNPDANEARVAVPHVEYQADDPADKFTWKDPTTMHYGFYATHWQPLPAPPEG